MDDELRRLTCAARHAAGILREFASRPLETVFKQDGSPTTEADLASQEALVRAVHELFPKTPLLVEEQDAQHLHSLAMELPGLQLISDLEAPLPDEYATIDPLDGTVFLESNYPVYAVSAAVVQGGRPELGVVCSAATGTTVAARRGGGSFVDEQPQKMRSSGPLAASLIGLDNCRMIEPTFRSRAIDPLVAACRYPLNLPSVASGIDLVLGRTAAWVSSNACNWDVAATSLAVEEAGGVCYILQWDERGWRLAPLAWNLVKMPPLLFAARQELAEEVLAVLIAAQTAQPG